MKSAHVKEERLSLAMNGKKLKDTTTKKKNQENKRPYNPTALRRVQISRGTPEDRLDRFPAVDQSVCWISRANSVPLRVLLSRIPYK